MFYLSPIAAAFLLILAPAQAADIVVLGLFPNKALVSINGAKPRMLAVGETSSEGVRLVAATSEAATFEVRGKRRTLAAGEGAAITMAPAEPTAGSVTLVADARGHFITTGVVNGVSLRFMVDTGATSVVLSSGDARRVGVNYLAGARSFTQTANGVVPVYNVKLDSVRVGDITLHNVDAVVIEGDRLPIALLGMSFLNRTEMRRDGLTMTLTRRY
jgi:aspartyl protease family protein